MKNIRNICNSQINYDYPFEFDSCDERSYNTMDLLNGKESFFYECYGLNDEEYNYFRLEFNSSLNILPNNNNNILVPENTMNKDANKNVDNIKMTDGVVSPCSVDGKKKCCMKIENCVNFSLKKSFSFHPVFYIEKKMPKIRKADICNIVSNKSINTETQTIKKNNTNSSFHSNLNNPEIIDNIINDINFRDGKFIIDLSPYKKHNETKCENNSCLLRKRKGSNLDKL